MGKQSGDWELITPDDFDDELLQSLKHGQVLGFKQADNSMKYWKVARIDSKHNKWWLKPWRLYDVEERDTMEADRKAIG